MTVDVADLTWLLGDEAAAYLRSEAQAGGHLAAQLARLRQSLSPARAHLVVEQRRLRERAREKFPRASELFFLATPLEQATDAHLAAYKAARFGRAPAGPRADLCCGLGGDLMALAAQGEVTGVERNEPVALLAEANCRAATGREIEVRRCDVRHLNPAEFAAWHCDPDRRASGRRTTEPRWHEPPLEELDRWRRLSPHAAIKLAPAATLPDSGWGEAELQWLGRARECKQLVAWFGALAELPGQRRASVIGSDGELLGEIAGRGDETAERAEQLGPLVCEPHAAVLAAGLDGALARRYGLAQLAPQVAYYTGHSQPNDPLLATFEVLAALPFDQRRLRAYLRQQGIGRVEIKKRSVEIQPERLAKQLAGPGSAHATVVVTPFAQGTMALVCRRPFPTTG